MFSGPRFYIHVYERGQMLCHYHASDTSPALRESELLKVMYGLRLLRALDLLIEDRQAQCEGGASWRSPHDRRGVEHCAGVPE